MQLGEREIEHVCRLLKLGSTCLDPFFQGFVKLAKLSVLVSSKRFEPMPLMSCLLIGKCFLHIQP